MSDTLKLIVNQKSSKAILLTKDVIMKRKSEIDASVAPRMEIVTPKEFYDFLFTF